MTPDAGRLAFSDLEGLVLAIGGRRHLIVLDDVRSLMLYGRVVPVVGEAICPGREDYAVTIEGFAAVTGSRETVTIFTRRGSYIVPLASVRRVVQGNADSAPLFPVPPDWPGERP